MSNRPDVFSELHERGLIGKVWPVNRNDPSPAILALMVPRSIAVAELNHDRESDPITDADLVAAMRRKGVLDHRAHVPGTGKRGRA
jgi:hypothetical protein